MSPQTCEAGQQVFIQGKFHLGFCSSRLGAPGKDVQDQIVPVDDAAVQLFIDISDLAWREFVVENGKVNLFFLNIITDFDQLA